MIIFAVMASQAGGQTEIAGSKNSPQKIVREGIAVEFTITPVGREKTADPLEGDYAEIKFKVTDTNTGAAMTGMRPASWMDIRSSQNTDERQCRQKIQSFLQGSLGARPEIDLNSYYILAMNQEPNISVIDPILGFGSSKLLTLIFLPGPAEDWVLSRDQRRLFITIPSTNQVAIIDTTSWKMEAKIDVGFRPGRISLQPDEKYLWVGNEGGVSVIDADQLKPLKQIATGKGRHDLAFARDDLFAFVTNEEDGTLSIIDINKLERIKDLKIGRSAGAMAFSDLSNSVYVIDKLAGEIVAVDGRGQAVAARMKAKPGLSAIQMAPGGRWGFAANPSEDAIYIFDSSANRIVHKVEVGKRPDQIAFTDHYAYIRSAGTEQIYMIQLSDFSREAAVHAKEFPGGQLAPERAPVRALAPAIVPSPEPGAVLIANPADKLIYHYSEGMAAPMGSFQNYRRTPRAVLTVDRSLREVEPGVYSTTALLTKGGSYDVAFLLDSPRIVHCFEAEVKPNPANKKKLPQIAIQYLIEETKVRAGQITSLRFKVIDAETRQPKPNLEDLTVLAFLAPGMLQKRQRARSIGDGIYEVSLAPARPGAYYVFVECPSLKVRYNQLPYLILEVEDQKP